MKDTNSNIPVLFLRGFLMCSLILMFHASIAQKNELSPQKHRNLAVKSERYGDIYSAIEHYKAYLETKDVLSRSCQYDAYKLAGLYKEIRDYKNATIWYKKAYDANNKKYAQALFYYAQMLKMTGDYNESTKAFLQFKKINKDKKTKSYYRKYLKLEIEGNELAKTLIDSPLNVKLEHLDESINQAYMEFSPFFINDSTFYYASLKSDSVLVFDVESSVKIPTSRFYQASLKNDSWKGIREVPYGFNELDGNLGNGVLSQDGLRFYFTRCTKNDDGKTICSIYMSKKEMGIWNDPVKLTKKINTKRFTTTQPTLGVDPKRGYEVLYFISDRPGGKGGKDIWYSIYDAKKQDFKEPRNAGGKINTKGNEITPYFDTENSRLYFSSDFRAGLGGFDIYKSFGYLKKWEIPENIGYPINSSVDDMYYVLNENNRSQGLLVSNREGGMVLENITCCDDIYFFEYKNYVHLGVRGLAYELIEKDSLQYLENILSEGSEADSLERKKLSGVTISLYLVDSTEDILIRQFLTNDNANYFFSLEKNRQYKITANKPGYFSKQAKLSTVGRYLSDTLTRNLKLSPIPKKSIIVKNIYYPFDKYFLTDSAKAIIDTTIYRVLTENPQIIVEISSHTDNKGTHEYNIRLSEKRAKSVVEYLISRGINKKRLTAIGYGEKQPVAPNENEDGSDNPDGRQKNRRTEFKVIGETKEYSGIIYEE